VARSRNLKPAFFTNENLGECSPEARLLFAGLWCHADREGRLENRPKRLKVQILPFDPVSIPDLLEELSRWGMIVLYESEGRELIQIPTFLKHQHPHHREPSSDLPAPEGFVSPVEEKEEEIPVAEIPRDHPEWIDPTKDKPKRKPRVPVPNGEAGAEVRPWDLLEALCVAQDVDPNLIQGGAKARSLAIAKRLIQDGIGVPEIERITGWLRSQDWVRDSVDMNLIEKQLPRWTMAGRPDVQSRGSSAKVDRVARSTEKMLNIARGVSR
jgi:hypothetical protein